MACMLGRMKIRTVLVIVSMRSVSKSCQGQPKRAAQQSACDHTARCHLLRQRLLDTHLSSCRRKPSTGRAWCSRAVWRWRARPCSRPGDGISESDHVPVSCTCIPTGAAVLAAERCCSRLRDENRASRKHPNPLMLLSLPLLLSRRWSSVSYRFMQRNYSLHPPPHSQATPGQAVPSALAFVTVVSHGGFFPRSAVTDRPSSLPQPPSKWEKPGPCAAQGWGNAFVAEEAFYNRA